MKATTPIGLLVLGWALAAVAAPADKKVELQNLWDFEQETVGQPPPGFAFVNTKVGKPGRWVIEAQEGAPSGAKVLAQREPDATEGRRTAVVFGQAFGSNVQVASRCKAVSGDKAQACGVMFRYRDENNHYLAQLDARDKTVKLFHMKEGKLTPIASKAAKLTAGWNYLVAECVRDQLRVLLNGKKLIQVKDGTFRAGGKVGLTTTADSVIQFDDFSVTNL